MVIHQLASFPQTRCSRPGMSWSCLLYAVGFLWGLSLDRCNHRSPSAMTEAWAGTAPAENAETWGSCSQVAVCQNLIPLVNINISGKWMFIPLKMVLIGIDPYPGEFSQTCEKANTIGLSDSCQNFIKFTYNSTYTIYTFTSRSKN